MTPENVGQQFTTLYRGIASTHTLKDVYFDRIGRHWTPDREVAHSFATSAANDPNLEKPHPWSGVILQAQVPTEHIIDPESDEGKELASKHKIFSREHGEEEHTLREGTPVSITGVTKVDGFTEREMKRFPKSGRS